MDNIIILVSFTFILYLMNDVSKIKEKLSKIEKILEKKNEN